MLFLVGVGIIAFIVLIATLFSLLDGRGGLAGLWFVAGVVVTAIWSLIMSISPVSTGHVGVGQWFGAVQETAYPEGLRFMNPMYDVTKISIQRRSVDFSAKAKDADGPTIVSMSKDHNPVQVEASFPYSINPSVAWKILQRIGDEDALERNLIVPAARAAVRDAIASFPWADASVERRADVEQRMMEEVVRAVNNDLIKLGFTDTEAKGAITFMPVLLREVLPDAKVLNAIAERMASEEDRKRQKLLTQIAEEQAARRSNEGIGVKRLFEQLPDNFTPAQIRDVLLALAEKERADALMKAVETGKVNVMVLPSSTPVAVPAQ